LGAQQSRSGVPASESAFVQAEMGCAALNEPHNSSSGRRRAATAALLIQGFGQRMWINDQRTVAWRTAAEPE
jgi:hypothetical protein